MRAFATLLICLPAAFGQATAPRFEVASIRPSSVDQMKGSTGGHSGDGRLTMNNATLKRCIIGAYGIGPNQVVGGPAWVDEDRFEIQAKADSKAGDQELMVMLQSLLAERFHLVVHREMRTISAFVLEVAKNGPKLEKGEGGSATTNTYRGGLEAKNATMKRFAEVLSRRVDLPVVDHTGLEGVFNLKLKWAPESETAVKPGADADTGPSIFTAIQEQLGLRLHAQKAPVEMLVIDRAERPTEN